MGKKPIQSCHYSDAQFVGATLAPLTVEDKGFGCSGKPTPEWRTKRMFEEELEKWDMTSQVNMKFRIQSRAWFSFVLMDVN